MLALASILIGFATIACVYFYAPGRGQVGNILLSIGGPSVLGPAALGGLAASLALAVAAQGWAAGIGLWLAELMVAGVAIVSLAGNYPAQAQLLGCCSAATGLLLAIAQWVFM